MGCKDSKASKPTSKHGSNQSGLISREFTIDLVNKITEMYIQDYT